MCGRYALNENARELADHFHLVSVPELVPRFNIPPGVQVLVVSSGGPIATAIAHVLGAPPPAVVSLNLQMRNSALSELSTSASRHWLAGFNSVPHLDHPARAGWITYS